MSHQYFLSLSLFIPFLLSVVSVKLFPFSIPGLETKNAIDNQQPKRLESRLWLVLQMPPWNEYQTHVSNMGDSAQDGCPLVQSHMDRRRQINL